MGSLHYFGLSSGAGCEEEIQNVIFGIITLVPGILQAIEAHILSYLPFCRFILAKSTSYCAGFCNTSLDKGMMHDKGNIRFQKFCMQFLKIEKSSTKGFRKGFYSQIGR